MIRHKALDHGSSGDKSPATTDINLKHIYPESTNDNIHR